VPGNKCREEFAGPAKLAAPYARIARASLGMPNGKTCLADLGTVCRSVASRKTRSAKNWRRIKRLLLARGMACGLLMRPRDDFGPIMIAPPVQTAAASTKPPAAQQHQPPQANANGFLSLLSATDSALANRAQSMGAAASNVAAAANSKKAKANDPSGTPYVAAAPGAAAATLPSDGNESHVAAAPGAAATTLPSDGNQPLVAAALGAAAMTLPSDGNQPPVSASGAPGNAILPASDGSAADAQDGTNTAQSGTGISTAFGADELNARVAAGAPIYSSQPNAAMATIPAHLLDAANAHPLPGEPVGKPGNDASAKSAGPNATLPPTASPTATAALLLPTRPAVTAINGANDNDRDGAPAQTLDDNRSASINANDSSAPTASLLAQPNATTTAPLQVDAAVHTATPYVPVGEQVALNLKQAIIGDNNEIRIQLKPASLGTIDVKLNLTEDGRVSAVISADRSDTLNMLKQDSGALQQALRDAGLNADSSSLSFNLRSDAQSFAQNWSQSGGGNNANGAYPSGGSDALLGADAAAPAQRIHSGALDIEV
jgi:flagellar hook-length control protein FliK